MRSLAGPRLFGAADIVRLQQVLALKKAGCSLAQIGVVMADRSLSPTRLVEQQISALEARRAALDHALAGLRAAQLRMAGGQAMDLAQFCDLISTGETMMDNPGWQAVFDRYYTEEEQARFRAAKAQWSPGDLNGVAASWTRLIARVEAAIADGMAPESEAARDLACEWLELQRPMVEAVGKEAWNKSAAMYDEMHTWESGTVRSPFSAAVFAFINRASVGVPR